MTMQELAAIEMARVKRTWASGTSGRMYKTTPECERIVNEAIELAISIYGVTREQIIAKDRDLYASEARQAAMMFADNEGLSRTKIGTLMQRDHTTVSYGIRQAKKRLKVAR